MIQLVVANVRGQNTGQVTWNIATSSIVFVSSSVLALLMMVRETVRQMERRHTTFPV